ncbi:NADH-dependent butanol dehydrogenase [Fibrobacteres bacterium R8-0-B4]
MENFVFQNKTKIIFGRDAELLVGEETAARSKKVLLHYGGGSVKTSGLHDRVTASLKKAGVEYIELGGAQPNPRLSLVEEGIDLCRKHGIKFLLAVGGGSAIDSAKAMAVGVPYDGEVWDFYNGKATPKTALDVGTVLTIPAAGSESSPSAVITNENGGLKRGLTSELIRPVFSILNPELTCTLPAYQTACGAADIMAHIMERYFTTTKHADFTDRLCEATLKTIIHNVPECLKDPHNYDARAEVMWAGCVAHNDLLGTGRNQDWASHQIEHELSGMYDVAHGAGLAVIFPAWMKHVYKHNVSRFVQFAARVWNIEIDFHNQEKTALAGIAALERFFSSIGLPVRLKEMNIGEDKLQEMVDKCTGRNGAATVGGFVPLHHKDILEILMLARW